jgi:DNA invertase Pin-like site-specific DNA recombinase
MSTKPAAPAVAYSFVRFSTPEQLKGDSLRRQTQATEEWCRRNGVILDLTTTLHDLGKSAFTKGKRQARDDDGMAAVPELADLVNPDRRALAGFLELIKKRRVPRGSYLIIENLDRLSRDDTVPATHLLTGILLAGVRVVQLKPVEQVLTERSDGYAILMAVMELSRGNSESRVKSERIGAAWVNKRSHARNGKPLTRNVPAWVRVESIDHDRYTLALIPERAEVVSRIFALAAGGLGIMRVVQKLTEEGVPAFGRLLDDAAIAKYEERRRTAGKPPLTAKEHAALRRPGQWNWSRGEWTAPAWNCSYVRDILTDRRALGEFLPRSRRGQADGPPIPNYFPPVVDEATFNRVRAALNQRKNVSQKNGKNGVVRRIGKHVDLFAGLIFDAVDGSPYYGATKTEGRGSRRSS